MQLADGERGNVRPWAQRMLSSNVHQPVSRTPLTGEPSGLQSKLLEPNYQWWGWKTLLVSLARDWRHLLVTEVLENLGIHSE